MPMLPFRDHQMCNISETTLSGCYRHRSAGLYIWTAGQRIDPSRNSTFVWRVTSHIVSAMSYTNWESGEPNYRNYQDTNDNEACMHIRSGRSYRWNDFPCSAAMCSVCEI